MTPEARPIAELTDLELAALHAHVLNLPRPAPRPAELTAQAPEGRSRFASLIRDVARRCRGRHECGIREELKALAAEVERQDAELQALHLRTDYQFALVFAEFLNDESGAELHPLAAELLAGVKPDRALEIARAVDSLTPRSVRFGDLRDYFDALDARLGGHR